jgi:tetratricopeptide (TPR) repeat protein
MNRCLTACFTLGLLLLVGLARAQEAPEQVYEQALDRALAAHASGDYQVAESAMREAHALSPNARTLRGLGVILYAQGRYAEAVAPLEAAREHALKPLSAELRVGVDELLLRIWQRIGRLLLRSEPAASEIAVDGAAPLLHGPAEILLTAGEHQVRISAPGREPYELSLRTQAGSRDSLHVVLAPRVERLASVRVEAPMRGPLSSAPRSDRAWSPVLRNSLFAASAAVVAAGAVSWLVGYLRFRELNKECPSVCADEADAVQRFKQERIAPLTATGIALMATGGAALLALGGVELWQRKKRSRPQLALTPGGAQLRHQF